VTRLLRRLKLTLATRRPARDFSSRLGALAPFLIVDVQVLPSSPDATTPLRSRAGRVAHGNETSLESTSRSSTRASVFIVVEASPSRIRSAHRRHAHSSGNAREG
jgi:hypothetical protein